MISKKSLTFFFKKNPIEVFVILFSLAFSFWLMFSTFSYQDGSMLIATKAWSDFGSHIPLIRSFSLGNNLPPEYPIFSGEPIRYHFFFYLLAGLFEKLGFRIDCALNLPSAFSFFSLMFAIYFLAKILFKNKIISFLSLLFFLFNGSFSSLEFFKNHPFTLSTFNDVLANKTFPSFGPYDEKIVSAFWNLNIYTNQRHLALPLAFLFILVLLVISYEKRKDNFPKPLIFILGILIGLLPFSHSSIFIMVFAVLVMLFLLLPHQRKPIFFMLFIGAVISLPRVLFLKQTASYVPHIQLGYLIANDLNLLNFIRYWFLNLGLSFILIPVGFLLASGLQKKVLIAFFSLFFIGNLVQFSPEIASNHKFFNAFLILANMYVAFTLVKIWQFNYLGKIFVPFIIFFLILSGIIDFFPIRNDTFIALSDYPKNPDIGWIIKNTPKNSVFLNASYLYNPASLAGRKIFLGWPYFPWSLGYDTYYRDALRKKLLNSNDFVFFCKNVKKHNIKYVILENQIDNKDVIVNYDFFEQKLKKLYENQRTKLRIYTTELSC